MPGVVGYAIVLTAAVGLNCMADITAQRLQYQPHFFTALHRREEEEEEEEEANAVGTSAGPASSVSSVAEEVQFEVDWKRTGRWIIWPTIPNVLVTAFTYGSLVPAIFGYYGWDSLFEKILVRVCGHLATAFGAIVGNRLLAGDPWSSITFRLKNHFPPCAFWSCLIWFPADVVQFLFIPEAYQVLWIYFYNLVAGIVLSYFVNLVLLEAPVPDAGPVALGDVKSEEDLQMDRELQCVDGQCCLSDLGPPSEEPLGKGKERAADFGIPAEDGDLSPEESAEGGAPPKAN